MTSSTSGFPSSKFITACTKNPARILVAHPINPPHLIPAVEIVPHPSSDPATVDRCVDFYRSIGQKPVRVAVETPGFVLNRLQAVLLFEAFSLVHRGVISPGDLDDAVTAGLGLRWALSGPFMNPSLSGGGGPQGFKRAMDHLGPAAEAWIKDTDSHRFQLTDENKEAMVTKVAGMFEGYGDTLPQRVKARDEAIVEVIKVKKEIGKGLLS